MAPGGSNPTCISSRAALPPSRHLLCGHAVWGSAILGQVKEIIPALDSCSEVYGHREYLRGARKSQHLAHGLLLGHRGYHRAAPASTWNSLTLNLVAHDPLHSGFRGKDKFEITDFYIQTDLPVSQKIQKGGRHGWFSICSDGWFLAQRQLLLSPGCTRLSPCPHPHPWGPHAHLPWQPSLASPRLGWLGQGGPKMLRAPMWEAPCVP